MGSLGKKKVEKRGGRLPQGDSHHEGPVRIVEPLSKTRRRRGSERKNPEGCFLTEKAS